MTGSVFLLFLAFWAVGGIGGFLQALEAIIGIIGFPLIFWYVGAYVSEGLVFRAFFIKRLHERILRRFHITPPESEYFLVEPRFPKRVTWRFLQTLSVFLLSASTVAYAVPSPGPRNPATEISPFLAAGIVAMFAVMPLVVLLWVYEDSGVRRYDKEKDTISRVGTLFEQFLFGSGTISAFLRLLASLNAPIGETIGWAVAVLILFPPICLALTVIFHREAQLILVKRIIAFASENGFQQRSIRLD